jgi:hypothetical protein
MPHGNSPLRYGGAVQLISFTIENFRRFVGRTSMKLHADLIALIGPNEAGKSSILQGLALLRNDDPFARTDEHRRSRKSPRLAWNFQLEDDDKAALAEIPEANSVERVVITKVEDGTRVWTFYPDKPTRDRTKRDEVAELIEQFMRSPGIDEVPRDPDDDFMGALQKTLDAIRAGSEDLDSNTINLLGLTGAQIETLNLGFNPEDLENLDGRDEDQTKRQLLELRDQVRSCIYQQARRETDANPAVAARAILEPRLPSMITYTQEDRDLHGSYDLEEVADNPPPALKHLSYLANLDLVGLRQEIRDGLRADVATRRDSANHTLRDAFDKSWNQQKVALQIDVDGPTLFVHAISLTAPEAGMSNLNERSDGMRWFASLLAFVHGWGENPILLVDEIETHLHYDAQADLIHLLERQEFTSKVIYTTHSFGCLPPDLGCGVRLVQPIDETTSQLVEGFWRNGVGFSPLLTSMGAAAVSFTPSRHAVIVEGPSDAILMPTLLRQASEDGAKLGFQIAPGVAEVATAKSKGLEAEAGRVAFLVDGDEGGRKNRKKLIDGGIDAAQIIVLAEAADEGEEVLETEDLVDAEVYVAAVNRELACWGAANELKVTTSDLGSTLRTKALNAWCEKNQYQVPDKVAVAEHVIEMSTEKSIFDANRQTFLQQLRDRLGVQLGLS